MLCLQSVLAAASPEAISPVSRQRSSKIQESFISWKEKHVLCKINKEEASYGSTTVFFEILKGKPALADDKRGQ